MFATLVFLVNVGLVQWNANGTFALAALQLLPILSLLFSSAERACERGVENLFIIISSLCLKSLKYRRQISLFNKIHGVLHARNAVTTSNVGWLKRVSWYFSRVGTDDFKSSAAIAIIRSSWYLLELKSSFTASLGVRWNTLTICFTTWKWAVFVSDYKFSPLQSQWILLRCVRLSLHCDRFAAD